MDEKQLDDYLDEVGNAMAHIERSFWGEWNARLSSLLATSAGFDIRDSADVFGGFRLSPSEFAQLDPCLRRFFDSRSQPDGERVLLRGYTYYACDPQLYRASRRPSDAMLWSTFLGKWNGYQERPDFSFLDRQPVAARDWIGTVSYLEYLFADLTTLDWFVIRKRPMIEQRNGRADYQELLDAVKTGIRQVADGMAALLTGEPVAWAESVARAGRACGSTTINDFLATSEPLAAGHDGDVRSVREADSTPLVLAVWQLKLRPHLAEREPAPLLIVGNAFGALNLGELFAALARREGTEATSTNIHYSQHRAAEGLFSPGAGHVEVVDGTLPDTPSPLEVIVADDCIFTGRSFEQITAWLGDRGATAALLPLAVDLPSIRDYQRGSRDVDATFAKAKRAVAWARGIGGQLPPFQAFWDWSCASLHSVTTDDPDVSSVFNNGDMLLKELWRRYPQVVETDGEEPQR